MIAQVRRVSRRGVSSFCALALVVLLFVGWGFGENGDLPFALSVVAVASCLFWTGVLVRRWGFVAVAGVGWLVVGVCGGGLLDPDGYSWAIGLFAPLVAVFVALGVTVGRTRTPGEAA